MKKIVFITLFLYIGLLFFMPKLYLWYALEDYLNHQNIQLISHKHNTRFTTLHLEDNRLFYRNREIAKIRQIDFLPLIFFNRITLEDLSWEHFLAKNSTFTHSVLEPFKIKTLLNGDFGDIVGEINLKDHTIVLTSIPTKKFQKNMLFQKLFYKTDEGYRYESNF